MKSSGLVIERTIQIKATFNRKLIEGPVELLEKCVMFLSVNWEGEVERVVTTPLNKIKESLFEPSDKGGLSLFGVDSTGQVICGMVYYKCGTGDNRDPHYEIYACDSTNCHPW